MKPEIEAKMDEELDAMIDTFRARYPDVLFLMASVVENDASMNMRVHTNIETESVGPFLEQVEGAMDDPDRVTEGAVFN